VNILKVILAFFLGELVLGGPGFWSIGTGITLRKMLFSASVILLYGYSIFKIRLNVYTRDLIIFACILLSLIIWMVCVPLLNGESLGYAFDEASSIFIYVLYFPLLQLFRSNLINWEQVKSYFINLVLCVAVCQIVLWIIGTIDIDQGVVNRYLLIAFFNTSILSENEQSIFVGPMPDGFYRVMWISTLYMIPAFFFILANKRMKKIYKYLACSILIFAIFISYTRSIWLGIILGSIYLVTQQANIPKTVIVCGLIMLSINVFLMSSVINLSSIIPERMIMSQDAGTLERLYQVPWLIDKWLQHFFIGTGFGGFADYVRIPDAPYNYEFTALALLMKLGIIGITLWIGCIVYFIRKTWGLAVKNNQDRQLAFTLASLIAFVIAGMTNPYIFNFVGMAILVIHALDIEYYCSKKAIEI
jgi:hypothetical protein